MSPGECLRRLERAARPRQKTQAKFLHIRAIRVYSWFLSFSFHCAAGGSGTYQRHLAARVFLGDYPRVSALPAPAVILCSAPPAHASKRLLRNCEFRMFTTYSLFTKRPVHCQLSFSPFTGFRSLFTSP